MLQDGGECCLAIQIFSAVFASGVVGSNGSSSTGSLGDAPLLLHAMVPLSDGSGGISSTPLDASISHSGLDILTGGSHANNDASWMPSWMHTAKRSRNASLVHLQEDELAYVAPTSAPTAPGGEDQRYGGIVRFDTSSTSGAETGMASSAILQSSGSLNSVRAAELLCRLHGAALSCIGEVEMGALFTRRPQQGWSVNGCPSGHTSASDGSHTYYRYPVENGQYVAAISLPAVLRRHLGGSEALVSLLCRTVICGYDVGPQAATNAATLLYLPLHHRLTNDAAAVHRAVVSGLQTLRQVLQRCQSQPVLYAARVCALRRMCTERPSALRTHPSLWTHLDQLLHAATNATDAASLRGGLTSMGVQHTERRFLQTAAAVWYRGHPLHSSNGAASSMAYEGFLLPVALRLAMEDFAKCTSSEACFTGASTSITQQTMKCVAVGTAVDEQQWGGRGGPLGSGASGYTMGAKGQGMGGSSKVKAGSAAVGRLVLCMTTSSGWVVALLLEVVQVHFIGAPLRQIISGIQRLLQQHFDSESFFRIVRGSTTALRSWQRPMSLLSLGMRQVENAVRSLRIVRRRCGSGGGAAVRCHSTLDIISPSDVILLQISRHSASQTEGGLKSAATRWLPSTAVSLMAGKDAEVRKALRAKEQRAQYAAERNLDFGVRSMPDIDPPYWHRVEQTIGVATRLARQLALQLYYLRRRRCGVGAAAPPATTMKPSVLQRCRTVHSLLIGKDCIVVVQAVPHVTASSVELYYMVVEYDKSVLEQCLAELLPFSSWMLSKVL